MPQSSATSKVEALISHYEYNRFLSVRENFLTGRFNLNNYFANGTSLGQDLASPAIVI
jgi:hypothetical protein